MFGPRLVPDDTTISFMKGRFAGLIVSAILSIGSLILAFYPGLNYGIDFKGGIAIVAHMPNEPDFQRLSSELDELNLGPVELQEFGSPLDVQISMQRQPGRDSVQQERLAAVRDLLLRNYPGTTMQPVNAVGATVSAERFRDGVIALGIALTAMLGYIWVRFQWPFVVAGTATLALDVIKIVGLYGLTQYQLGPTSIVAILTIMGYSIHDKTVVYDRVRDNLRLYRTMNLCELIDRSINETLNRRMATSGTVLLVIIPLAVMGSRDVQQFASILIMGIVIGALSSIFIAAPILLLLGEGRVRPKAMAMATPEHERPALRKSPIRR